MYILYIVTALAAVLAAVLRGRRKYRRYLRGTMDHKLQLATLAGNTLVGSDIGDSVNETTWVSSVKANYSIANYTPSVETGPFILGWAHSDYSDGEIEEWVEQANSWNVGDKVSQEQSRRLIRQIGTFETLPLTVSGVESLNDGRMKTTKIGFMLESAQTLRFWVYNAGTAAVATSDPEIRVQGHANLWPK